MIEQEMLNTDIATFEENVFHGGEMLAVVKKGPHAGGMSGTFGSITLLTFRIAGCVALTFAKNNGKNPIVTLVAHDDGSRGMGLQSLDGQPAEAIAAIQAVTRQWQISMRPPTDMLKPDCEVVPAC